MKKMICLYLCVSVFLCGASLLAIQRQQSEEGMAAGRISRANAEHYTWGERCDAWHLVKEQSLSVIEEQMPPGTSETLHFHTQAQQFFYLLSGEVVIEVDGRQIRLHPGEGVRIPPGTRHQIRNHSSRPAGFLVISEPPSHGDRKEG